MAKEPTSSWVIWLAPGGSCDDNSDSCAERNPELTTTPPQADGELHSLNEGGLFNQDASLNPATATANHVFAYYCSSDLWTGNSLERHASSGDPVNGWYFSGHANVDAMMDMLVERYGLDDSDPTLQVLFGGSSAGRMGAAFNARRVAERLPSTWDLGHFRVLIDAGWMVDWANLDYPDGAAETVDHVVRAQAREFWQGSFDAECEADHANDPVRVLCYRSFCRFE
jgi:hypothetical protein